MADEKDIGKITLDIKDLIGVVAKGLSGAGHAPISGSSHSAETEQVTKDWINATVRSIAAVSATLETVRTIEIPAVKKEFRDELIKIEKRLDKNDTTRVSKESIVVLKEIIDKLERKVDKQIEVFEDLKTKTIKPISDSLIAISVKIGIYGLIAGFVGSGLMAFVIYVVQFVFHQATGTPPVAP